MLILQGTEQKYCPTLLWLHKLRLEIRLRVKENSKTSVGLLAALHTAYIECIILYSKEIILVILLQNF